MSQHVSETCNEGNGLWLPLIEYSVKSGVSLSTIRRKIKSNSISYRLEKGRYLILLQDSHHEEPQVERCIETEISKPISVKTDSVTDNAVRMVSDAFEHAIKEKEERLCLLEKRNLELEEHLNELRLLVQILEEKYVIRY